MTSRPGTARAQPGIEDILEIPVHPNVPTILHLPDAITSARVNPGSSMEVTLVGRTLHVRPDPGVPTGLEALLAVETPTMLLTFRLRVVERSEDAREELVVVAMQSEQRAEVGPIGGSPEPAGSMGPIGGSTEPAGSSRFALSLHVTTALAGVTTIHVPGYAPEEGRRSHRSFGLRFAIAPRNAWWAVEANIGGKWLDAPTVHLQNPGGMREEERRVSGPWTLACVGLRAGVGAKWRATAFTDLGLQTQLRETEHTSIIADIRQRSYSTEDLPLAPC